MIKKKIKFTIPEYREKKEIYEILGYKEIEVKEKGFRVFVTFEIDNKDKHYYEIKKIERMYNIKGPTIFPVVIFIVLSFILLSIFAIRLAQSFRDGVAFDLVANSLYYILPALALQLINVIYTYLYFKINQWLIARGPLSKEDIKLMVEKVKES